MLLVRCHCGGLYLHILGLVCCFTLSLSEGLQDLAKHRVQVNLASLYTYRDAGNGVKKRVNMLLISV